MVNNIKNKRAETHAIHIIVGIMLIFAGIFYILGQNAIGLIIATIGLLAEAIINWLGKIGV